MRTLILTGSPGAKSGYASGGVGAMGLAKESSGLLRCCTADHAERESIVEEEGKEV